MSEERIKERCKREDIALKIVEGFLEKHCDKDTELYYSLETLLDLYQKEKEKNRLLIEGKFREVADKNSYIKDNYISKDKIKEKIENLEGYIQENSDEQGYWGSEHQEDIYAKIEILEELLGE